MRALTLDLPGSLGYSADAVSSGERAIEYVREQRVDGLDTYLEVARLQPDVRTVVISGYACSSRVRCLQQAAKAPVVAKPITRENLDQALKEIFLETTDFDAAKALC